MYIDNPINIPKNEKKIFSLSLVKNKVSCVL